MPKDLPSAFLLKKNQLEQFTPSIQLWEVEVSDTLTLYLANHPVAVRYQGHDYLPFPITHDEIKEEAQGRLQRLSVRVSNVTREVQYYLEHNDGLRGRSVTLILVYYDPADPEGSLALGEIRQVYTIDAVQANDQVAVFVLGKGLPLLDLRPRVIDRDLFPALPLA